MSPQEQESLLLRQLAALRREGLPHDRALATAGQGLKPGVLASRVGAARRTLESGEVCGPQEDLLDRILARGTDAPETLDHAAAAIDARLAVGSSLALTRLYLAIGSVSLLLIGCLVGWVFPRPSLYVDGAPGVWIALDRVLAMLRWGGIPLACGALVMLGPMARRFAPGVRAVERAAALLEAAAAGTDPGPLVVQPIERAYYESRRPQVGAPQAASELAEELVREGERKLVLFRHLAPILGAVGLFVVMAPMGVVLGFMVLRELGGLL
jgi:hypothetical protein